METRVCKYCGEEKPIEDYEEANTVKGKVYRRWRCHQCYMLLKSCRKNKIKEWFITLKKTFKCKKCGDNRYYVLVFHHRNSEEKEINLGEVIGNGWSKKRILKEIKKCDVLCSNCHRELHWKQNK